MKWYISRIWKIWEKVYNVLFLIASGTFDNQVGESNITVNRCHFLWLYILWKQNKVPVINGLLCIKRKKGCSQSRGCWNRNNSVQGTEKCANSWAGLPEKEDSFLSGSVLFLPHRQWLQHQHGLHGDLALHWVLGTGTTEEPTLELAPEAWKVLSLSV
jgi:hypothetical protein